MRVISLHDQQAGEVPWEADSRDRMSGQTERAVVDIQRGRGRWARRVTTAEERVLRWG